MSDQGSLQVTEKDGIATITFSHPRANSLPSELLANLAESISTTGSKPSVKVLLLQSKGGKAFCAGASFDELSRIKTESQGKDFFMGFARVILAARGCPSPIVTRVQGKVVGGGVGLVAASDYVLATDSASLKLSELALGIGPFVVGPAIERKIGVAQFTQMALDAEWRMAQWGVEHGLYVSTYDSIPDLDSAVESCLQRFAGFSDSALAELKQILWQETEHFETLLSDRAALSGKLVLSEYTQKAIAAFQKKT